MSAQSVDLELRLGMAIPSPAPASIMEKLQSVQVTFSDDSPGVFQLVFHADREKGLSNDFPLLSSPLLQSSNRVVISVALNGVSHVLMDGFITHQELSHSTDFGASTLTVTGEDVSVLMDLIEIPFEYPQLGDAMIALAVLAKYAFIGVLPTVIPTPSDLIPSLMERVPQQNSTDRSYLKELASIYGYVFHVRPGPVVLTNVAYWGPPLRLATPKTPLSVDLGPATNVNKLDFTYDAIAPTLVNGIVQDTELDVDMPLTTFTSTRLPHFASHPALGLAKIFQRRQLFTEPQYGILKAAVDAQAITDTSTDRVVVGQGSLDGIRYGDVLEAPGVVEVRGVGQSYDGKYYVQSVTHSLSRGRYDQQFTLTREGLGSTISSVNV